MRLFLHGVESKVAFPGVAALYRALHHGVSGQELNPMLYVSRDPGAYTKFWTNSSTCIISPKVPFCSYANGECPPKDPFPAVAGDIN